MVSQSVTQSVSLDSLREGHTVITSDAAGYFIENCKVCLNNQQHESGVVMRVKFDKNESLSEIRWAGDVSPNMIAAWGQEDKRNAEISAIALTALLLPMVSPYQMIESAGYGTGVDYVLVRKSADDTLIFNDIIAYLEITGISRATQHNTVTKRIRSKKTRIDKIRRTTPHVLSNVPVII